MEMHTRASLHAIHGIDGRVRAPFSFRAWLSKVVKRIREAERRQRDYELLMRMSDHELSDIGMTRADVYAFQHGWRPTRRNNRG